MGRAVLALGSNLGDRMAYLCRAVQAIERLPDTTVQAVSRVYETDPVGYANQPFFLNAVMLVETGLSPRALLGGCLGIEAALGRERSFANAPRVLDLDVLLIEGVREVGEELTVPHPRMAERGFVLIPLLDLFPNGKALGVDFSQACRYILDEGAGVRLFADFPASVGGSDENFPTYRGE